MSGCTSGFRPVQPQTHTPHRPRPQTDSLVYFLCLERLYESDLLRLRGSNPLQDISSVSLESHRHPNIPLINVQRECKVT